MNTYQPHRFSLGGLDANIMALLCYLVTLVGGLIPVVKYVAWLLPLRSYSWKREAASSNSMQCRRFTEPDLVCSDGAHHYPDGSRRRGGCCRRIGCRDRRRG